MELKTSHGCCRQQLGIVLLYLFVNANLANGVGQWNSRYDYVFADFHICKKTNPDIVIWVQGRASNSAHRTVIREYMATQKLWPPGIRVTTLFFVGRSRFGNETQSLLEYEFEHYGDIVQNNYMEHYRNQTAKMMSAINFIADYCPKIKLAIRIDDDVFFIPSIMISRLMDILNSIRISRNVPLANRQAELARVRNLTLPERFQICPINTVLCRYLRHRDIKRHKTNRYRLPPHILENRTHYPDYCGGFFIVFTPDLLKKFQSAFKSVQPFWIDDAYLGVVQETLHTANYALNRILFFNAPKYNRLKQVLENTSPHWISPIAVHMKQFGFYTKLGLSGLLNFAVDW